MNDKLEIINQQIVLGKEFKIYGSLDNPLFLVKDVANWIEHTHTTNMLKNVDDDEKLSVTILHAGQNRDVLMLTEDGFYEVLMQSRKPIAKQFKREVKKILKDIRKNDMYIGENTLENMLSDPDTMIQLLTEYKAVKEKNKIMRPKAENYDLLMDSKGDLDFNSFTKSANLIFGRNKFMDFLRSEKILRKKPSVEPYQSFIDRKYFKVIQTTNGLYSNSKTIITKKGVDWLMKKCKEWNLFKD